MHRELERIHPQARIGAVCLVSIRASALAAFYRERVGLQVLARREGAVLLGAGGRTLLVLREERHAQRTHRAAGLFHLALRVPDRPALAAAVRRLTERGGAVEGFADHLVSEAVYLRDPEGNGVEIYHDRPREGWFQGGRLRMATLPLDVEGLLSELPSEGSPATGLPLQTVVGHVHLRVSDLAATEHFLTEGLGFQLTSRFGPQAGFVSAGGYHHHIGFNTWGGPFTPPPAGPAAGLGYYPIQLPDARELEKAEARLRRHGFAGRAEGAALTALDPSGIRVLLETGQGEPPQ